MLKKYFDWTPSDLAAWEKIRAKGLRHFILWYGFKLFSGVLFLFLGGAVFLGWLKASLEGQNPSIAAMGLQLLFVAAICLAGGLLTALATWWMEENIYHRLLKHKLDTESDKTSS